MLDVCLIVCLQSDPGRRAMFYPLVSATSPLRRLVPATFFEFPRVPSPSTSPAAEAAPVPTAVQVEPLDKAQPVLVLPPTGWLLMLVV